MAAHPVSVRAPVCPRPDLPRSLGHQGWTYCQGRGRHVTREHILRTTTYLLLNVSKGSKSLDLRLIDHGVRAGLRLLAPLPLPRGDCAHGMRGEEARIQ